jgi:hypothetical protein
MQRVVHPGRADPAIDRRTLNRPRDQAFALRRRLGFSASGAGGGAGLRPRLICIASAWRWAECSTPPLGNPA